LGRGNVKVSIQSAFDDKGVRKAETSLDHLNTHAKRSFGEATKHALGYGAALVGGAGIVGGLEAVAHASIDAGKAQAALDAQLKAVGISYKDHREEIDKVLTKTSQLTGFMDKDLEGALGNIVRSTGNLGQSFKLIGLAADIARTKHIGVADAGQLIGKIFAGNTRVLKSLGIQLDPVTKAQDKLKESTKHASDEQKRAAVAEDKRATAQKAIAALQQKLGGQAEAYGKTTAGSLDKMKAAVDRLEIKIGNALAPTIKDVATKVGNFVTQMEQGKGAGGRFADQMDKLWGSIKPVLKVVVDTAKWLGKHPALLKAAAGGVGRSTRRPRVTQLATRQGRRARTVRQPHDGCRRRWNGRSEDQPERFAGQSLRCRSSWLAPHTWRSWSSGPVWSVREAEGVHRRQPDIGVKINAFPHLEVNGRAARQPPKGRRYRDRRACTSQSPNRQPIGDVLGIPRLGPVSPKLPPQGPEEGARQFREHQQRRRHGARLR
jgi:hypothetical protein